MGFPNLACSVKFLTPKITLLECSLALILSPQVTAPQVLRRWETFHKDMFPQSFISILESLAVLMLGCLQSTNSYHWETSVTQEVSVVGKDEEMIKVDEWQIFLIHKTHFKLRKKYQFLYSQLRVRIHIQGSFSWYWLSFLLTIMTGFCLTVTLVLWGIFQRSIKYRNSLTSDINKYCFSQGESCQPPPASLPTF